MIRNRSKYNAIRTEIDGINFDSKLEAARYVDLKTLRLAGDVLYFLRQVPIRLPGKVVYRVDFQVFWSDGSVTYEDVKGYFTKMSKLKIKQVEDLYPIKIEVIK